MNDHAIPVVPGQAVELDLRGLKCPLPVLLTRKALRLMADGGCLVVMCTDPLAGVDIPHLVRQDGHTLEGRHIIDGVATFRIVKHRRGS